MQLWRAHPALLLPPMAVARWLLPLLRTLPAPAQTCCTCSALGARAVNSEHLADAAHGGLQQRKALFIGTQATASSSQLAPPPPQAHSAASLQRTQASVLLRVLLRPLLRRLVE